MVIRYKINNETTLQWKNEKILAAFRLWKRAFYYIFHPFASEQRTLGSSDLLIYNFLFKLDLSYDI